MNEICCDRIINGGSYPFAPPRHILISDFSFKYWTMIVAGKRLKFINLILSSKFSELKLAQKDPISRSEITDLTLKFKVLTVESCKNNSII